MLAQANRRMRAVGDLLGLLPQIAQGGFNLPAKLRHHLRRPFRKILDALQHIDCALRRAQHAQLRVGQGAHPPLALDLGNAPLHRRLRLVEKTKLVLVRKLLGRLRVGFGLGAFARDALGVHRAFTHQIERLIRPLKHLAGLLPGAQFGRLRRRI